MWVKVAPIDVGWRQDVAASILRLLGTLCDGMRSCLASGDLLGASGDPVVQCEAELDSEVYNKFVLVGKS